MQRCSLVEAATAVWLAFAATGCQEQPPPSLMIRAAVEAGAAQDEAAASPQGAGLLAEQLEVYLRQRQELLPARPQTQAAADVPAR